MADGPIDVGKVREGRGYARRWSLRVLEPEFQEKNRSREERCVERLLVDPQRERRRQEDCAGAMFVHCNTCELLRVVRIAIIAIALAVTNTTLRQL